MDDLVLALKIFHPYYTKNEEVAWLETVSIGSILENYDTRSIKG